MPSDKTLEIDYRSTEPMPKWLREAMEAHLAIESEDAQKSGNLGFMTRALVIATMPYKDPKKDVFTRTNGDFRLRIVAGYEGGIPFGVYPRLLMSWVSTEAVRTQSPVIELADSLSLFLREVLEIRSRSGGKRGSATRVSEQMKRLFGALISAQYQGQGSPRFHLKNVLIADDLDTDDADLARLDAIDGDGDGDESTDENAIWTPQASHEAGTWKSKVRLSAKFYKECVDRPVPIDLRAYKSLRDSPLAMDIYTWLTYRMSYTEHRSRPIRWEPLAMQFGSGYGAKADSVQSQRQAIHDFKKNFLIALKRVLVVYPEANVDPTETGLVLLPSRPHVRPVGQLVRKGIDQGDFGF